jgi:hypothetical protein
MLTRRDIEFILSGDLERARVAFESARENFRSIMSDIPSGIPQPDGTLRIELAGTAFRIAIDDYSVALREFNNFLIDGAVPERLIADQTPS